MSLQSHQPWGLELLEGQFSLACQPLQPCMLVSVSEGCRSWDAGESPGPSETQHNLQPFL